MHHDDENNALLTRIRTELDTGAADLPPRVTARLRDSRQQAVARWEKHPWLFACPRWATVGGLATAVTLLVAVSLWFQAPLRPQPVGTMEDLEIVSTQDGLDLFEDLEFFRWLAEDRDAS